MDLVYWICLGGGLAVTFALVLFDGLLDAFDVDLPDGLLDPLSLVGGAAAFGGAGVALSELTVLGTLPEVALAAVFGLALAVAMHFAYVRPMRRADQSAGFSLGEYRGKLGEVVTAIPARGYGEVVVRMGAQTTFRTAAAFEGEPIARGARIVVVDVRKGTLFVAPFVEEGEPPPELPAASPPRLTS
jgi:membrane-bound ClpP family serine protease